jgi:hypothetical protein
VGRAQAGRCGCDRGDVGVVEHDGVEQAWLVVARPSIRREHGRELELGHERGDGPHPGVVAQQLRVRVGQALDVGQLRDVLREAQAERCPELVGLLGPQRALQLHQPRLHPLGRGRTAVVVRERVGHRLERVEMMTREDDAELAQRVRIWAVI